MEKGNYYSMIFNKGRPMIAYKVWGINRFKKIRVYAGWRDI